MIVSRSLFVPIVAKSDTVENVTAFLASAIPLVEAEPKTIQWYDVKFTNVTSPTFAIFDTFPDDTARKAHLQGKVAAKLMAVTPTLFAEPPQIEFIDILAQK